MRIEIIHVTERFEDQFAKLPLEIKKKSTKVTSFFKENPFHPSLRLHKLKGKLEGLWSISVDRRYRIIFDIMDEGVVMYMSIGIHSIYEDSRF